MILKEREIKNFSKVNKLLFTFIFFILLFLLNTSEVFALGNKGNTGGSSKQENLNPTNDAMNALQKAGAQWIPTNSAQFLQYINPRQETLPTTFDDLTSEGQFIHYNMDGTASPDEASLAYNGYYDFRIQIRMAGEGDGAKVAGDYISRIYFKYIEITIEHRSVYKANPSIITVSGGPNVGLWMYLSSRVEVDELEQQNIFPIEYLDIFNEELKGDMLEVYWENAFYWPASEYTNSSGYLVTTKQNHPGGNEDFYNKVMDHDFRNYSGITTERASGLVWFQGSSTRDRTYSSYESNNPGCSYIFSFPTSFNDMMNQIQLATGIDYSQRGGMNSWYIDTNAAAKKSMALKHLPGNSSSNSEVLHTYRDDNGSQWLTYFIYRNNIHFTCRTAYTGAPELVGYQMYSALPIANDSINTGNGISVGASAWEQNYSNAYRNYSGNADPNAESVITKENKITGKKVTPSMVSRSAIHSVQTMCISKDGMLGLLCYIGTGQGAWSNAQGLYFEGHYTSNGATSNFFSSGSAFNNECKAILSEAGLDRFGKDRPLTDAKKEKLFSIVSERIQSNGVEWGAQFYALLYAASQQKASGSPNQSNVPIIWGDYTGGVLSTTTLQSTTPYWYRTYKSGYVGAQTNPGEIAAVIGQDELDIYIVDLYKAFNLTDEQGYAITEAVENGGAVPNVGLEERQLNAIKAALQMSGTNYNASLETSFYLTKDEINRGAISLNENVGQTPDDFPVMMSGFYPYAIVVRQKQVHEYPRITLIVPGAGLNIAANYTSFDSSAANYASAIRTILSSISGAKISEIGDSNLAKATSEAAKIFKTVGLPVSLSNYADGEQNPYVDLMIVYNKNETQKNTYISNMSTREFFDAKGDKADSISTALSYISNGFGYGAVKTTSSTNYNGNGNSAFHQFNFLLQANDKVGRYTEYLRIPYKRTGVAEAARSAAASNLVGNTLQLKANAYTGGSNERFFFAAVNIDTYAPYSSGNTLQANKRNTIDAQSRSFNTFDGKTMAVGSLSSSKNVTNKTQNVEIIASMGGIGTQSNGKYYNVGEVSALQWALQNRTGGQSTFGDLLYMIFTKLQDDGTPYYLSIASDLRVIVGDENDFNGYTVTVNENYLDSIKGGASSFLSTCGYDLGGADYSKVTETPGIIATALGIIFDRNAYTYLQIKTISNPEDMVVSNSHMDPVFVQKGSGTQISGLNRNTIDWFNNFSYTTFEPTARMSNKPETSSILVGGSASNGKYMIATDYSPQNLADKVGLIGKNTLSSPTTQATTITGYVYAGRVPEAKKSGLKVGDFTMMLSEHFAINGATSANEIFTRATTLLNTVYTNLSTNSLVKQAFNAFTDVYYSNILYTDTFTSTNKLTNITVTPNAYYMPTNGQNYLVANGTLVNKISSNAKVVASASTINNMSWIPGMVVEYKYTYSLPYGSQATTTKYIQDKAGSVYGTKYKPETFSGISVVDLFFTLVPTFNGSSPKNASINAFDDNRANNTVIIEGEVADGGNFWWDNCRTDVKLVVQVAGTNTIVTTVPVSAVYNNGYLNIMEDIRAIAALENYVDLNGCVRNGYDIYIDFKPTLAWKSYIFGAEGHTYHTVNQMDIYTDLSNIRGSSSKYLTEKLPNLLSGTSYAGRTYLPGDFKQEISMRVKLSAGSNFISVSEPPEIKVYVPGTAQHQDTTYACGANAINCASDNIDTEDIDCIVITFVSDGVKDNKVMDIILSPKDNFIFGPNSTNIALGRDNSNLDALDIKDSQSLIYKNANGYQTLASNLIATAIIERIPLNNIDAPTVQLEAFPGDVDTSQLCFWEVAYTAGGLTITQENAIVSSAGTSVSDYANGQVKPGTYTFKYANDVDVQTINLTASGLDNSNPKVARVLQQVGDKIAFRYPINDGNPITDVRITVGYRTEGSCYDNLDVDMDNNVREEDWSSKMDLEVKMESVPEKITIVSDVTECDPDLKVEAGTSSDYLVSQPATYQISFTVSVLLEQNEIPTGSANIDLSKIAATVYVYAENGGRIFYPSSIAGGDGGTSGGKTHIYNLVEGEKAFTATFTGASFASGDVNWVVEVWPWVNYLGPNGQTGTTYADNVRGGGGPGVSDIGSNSSLSIESNIWKPAGNIATGQDFAKNSTNNRDYATTKVTNKIVSACNWLCSQENEKNLANEVRWTEKFTWVNAQFAIADWTGISLGDGGGLTEIYYSDKASNIAYRFTESISTHVDVNQPLIVDIADNCGMPGDIGDTAIWAGGSNYWGELHGTHSTNLTYTSHNLYVYWMKATNISSIGTKQHWGTRVVREWDEEVEKEDEDGNKYTEIEHKEETESFLDHEDEHFSYTQLWYEAHDQVNTGTYVTYGLDGCLDSFGPDDRTVNWGPNGMLDGLNDTRNSYVNKQADEIGENGPDTSFGYDKKITLPTKYYKYIYEGIDISQDGQTAVAAPKPHGATLEIVKSGAGLTTKAGVYKDVGSLPDPSLGNWDNLSVSDVMGSVGYTAGGSKYNFYSEKVTASLEIAVSRNGSNWANTWIRFTGATGGSYTVYNGESFKVRGVLEYVCNAGTFFPVSPVQNIPDGSFRGKLVSNLQENPKDATVTMDDKGIWATTKEVKAGQFTGKTYRYLLVDFDDLDYLSGGRADGNTNWIKSTAKSPAIPRGYQSGSSMVYKTNYGWPRNGNTYWNANLDTVDKYEGKVKMTYVPRTGEGVYQSGKYGLAVGGYSSLSNGVSIVDWNSIDMEINLIRFLKAHCGLTNTIDYKQTCNSCYISGNKTAASASGMVMAEWNIKGTSGYNGYYRHKSNSNNGNNTKYYNVFPFNESGAETIDTNITNKSQTVTIYFGAVPFVGNKYKTYHPYLDFFDGEFGSAYLCDIVTGTINIRPVTAIVGDSEEDGNLPVDGEGGYGVEMKPNVNKQENDTLIY